MLRKRTLAAVDLQLNAVRKRRATLVAMLASHTDPKEIAATNEYIASADSYIKGLLENRARIIARNEAKSGAKLKAVLDRTAARAAHRIEVAAHRAAKASGTLPPAKAPGEIPDIGGDPM